MCGGGGGAENRNLLHHTFLHKFRSPPLISLSPSVKNWIGHRRRRLHRPPFAGVFSHARPCMMSVPPPPPPPSPRPSHFLHLRLFMGISALNVDGRRVVAPYEIVAEDKISSSLCCG